SRDGGVIPLRESSIFVVPLFASTFASPAACGISSVGTKSTFVSPPPTLYPNDFTDRLIRSAAGTFSVEVGELWALVVIGFKQATAIHPTVKICPDLMLNFMIAYPCADFERDDGGRERR